jgi:TP901 family phage tail tape measure protein
LGFLADTARMAVRIDLEGNAGAGIDKLTRQVNGLGGSTKKVGKGVGQLAGGFLKAGLVVGGAAVAGLTGAAKAAIDFEDAFSGVKKTVDEADLKAVNLSFDKLALSFRKMSTEIPIAATEFARLGETAGALGIKAGDIEEFVEITALMGVTTDLSADQAADAFGRIGTILGLTGDDYRELADSIVALGNDGASVESEITEIIKRFAAEGKAAGLAKEEIAGLASVTASLGFAPERGGTALARVFANIGTNISLANKKGTAFSLVASGLFDDLQRAKASGTPGAVAEVMKELDKSVEKFQDRIDKGQSLQTFTEFLQNLKGLSPTEANRALKAAGINNTSDRTILRAMADQLPEVNRQLEIAKTATGALSEESQKRFDTIASKLTTLKNTFTEAAITIGEGMLPAIGKASTELAAFINDPANKSELKALGEEIGRAIDDIDWADVLRDAKSFVGVLKSALAIVLDILGAVNKLPNEVKGAAAALLVLNKASGGLIGAGIGNIAGGLGGAAIGSIASRAPGVGRLFTQPVYVTNFPPGFGGGLGSKVGAAAAGAGAIGAGVAGAAIAAAVATTVLSTLPFADRNNAQGAKGLTKAEIAAVNYYAADRASQQTIVKRLGYVPDKADAESGNAKLQSKVETLEATFERKQESVKQATERVKTAQQETKRETTRGAALTTSATRVGSSAIVSAIYANRPQTFVSVNVNATTVSKTYNVSQRYGNKNASRNQDSNGSGTLGNGGR